MKGFLAACVIALAVSTSVAIDEAAKKKVVDTFKKCRETNPVTDAEVEQIKKHEGVPNSREAKCLGACMLKEGKMLKDNKYMKDIAITFAETLHNDSAEEAEKARKVIEECAEKVGVDVGSDECEFAYEMAVCGHEKALELGIEKPEWT